MPTYVPSKNKTSFTALIKRVEKIGSVCCFEKINSQIIEKYVAKWANENGKLISHLNASKIISNVGDDLNLLKNEVNKIAAYAKGEEITDRDIDLLSTVNLEARTYDMADDVINGRGDRAFRKLDTLSVSGKNRLTFSMHFHPPMSMRIVCVLQMNAQSVKKPWQKILPTKTVRLC